MKHLSLLLALHLIGLETCDCFVRDDGTFAPTPESSTFEETTTLAPTQPPSTAEPEPSSAPTPAPSPVPTVVTLSPTVSPTVKVTTLSPTPSETLESQVPSVVFDRAGEPDGVVPPGGTSDVPSDVPSDMPSDMPSSSPTSSDFVVSGDRSGGDGEPVNLGGQFGSSAASRAAASMLALSVSTCIYLFLV